MGGRTGSDPQLSAARAGHPSPCYGSCTVGLLHHDVGCLRMPPTEDRSRMGAHVPIGPATLTERISGNP
jgi:hypothetical protein